MARARQIKMKFAALTLHLEGMDKIEHAAKSSEHADSMVAFIGSAALNGMEKERTGLIYGPDPETVGTNQY